MKSFLKKKNMNINYESYIAPHFQLKEFTNSKIAKKLNINNEPTLLVLNHLKELATNLLEPFRQWYDKPVKVTSGFRCNSLNKAVGGSPTSVHPLGWGADILPVKDKFEDFLKAWDEFLAQHPEIKFDQIILEKSKKEQWLHVGLKNGAGKQRMQRFTLQVKDDKNTEGSTE